MTTIQKVLEDYLQNHGWTHDNDTNSYSRWLIEGKNAYTLWVYLTTDGCLRFEDYRGTKAYLRIINLADPQLFDIIDEETKRSHPIPHNAYAVNIDI